VQLYACEIEPPLSCVLLIGVSVRDRLRVQRVAVPKVSSRR
jgi:hypothetical protein